jgi:diguanylate cyclase (GGDEF)-like protein/PAS domain S-box-containing protein
MPETKHPLHLVGGSGDERPSPVDAELRRLRAEIDARNRQETAVAELGQAALTGVDSNILLGQACALIELTLEVDHCRALELLPAGGVTVRAAIGSNATFNHCALDASEDESLSLFVSVSTAPVIFTTLENETRFNSSHLRDFHGVRSGAAIAIPTANGIFGVLVIYSTAQRVFADFEIAFLQSTASLLGEALQRSRTEDALRRSESRLKQLIASTLDAVVTVDRNGVVIEWNPQAEATFGIPANRAVGHPLPRIVDDRTYAMLERLLARYRAGGATGLLQRRVEAIARRAGGEEFPIEATIDPVGSGDDQTFTAFVRDISERRRAQQELAGRERRFRALVEKSWSGVALLNEDLSFRYVGASTERLLGYNEADLLGTSFLGYIHPRDRELTRESFGSVATSAAHEASGEIRFLHKNGTWVWLEGFAQNLLDDPDVAAVVIHYRDISQRKATEKQLEYQAYYDALTGLPNRLLFRDRVENAIAFARRNRRGVAVMYIDLDHFKLVNDGLGHSVGDALLSEVASRLHCCIRASDTISRLGGDEFTILLNDTSSTESVAAVGGKILQSMSKPMRVAGHELFVTASIGISVFPNDGDDVEALLKAADSAMYRAKELGRNQVQLFTASMNERYARRLAMEQSLHHAVEREELEVWYQPICDRARRKITSVEALLRWRHPERGVVAPAEFIGLAEETGLIVTIGTWVLRRVAEQLRDWRAAGFETRASVNISAPQLQQPNFVEVLARIVDEFHIAPGTVELEITETVAVQNIELTMQVLREIKQLGFGIAIDDFGTGQSSLVYLKRFPIDTVKIDQTFVRDVTFDDSAAAIVSYVINLAHTLRLTVVAEGVETEPQAAFLKLNACDQIQGYLLSRPLPADDVAGFVSEYHRMHRSAETRRPA